MKQKHADGTDVCQLIFMRKHSAYKDCLKFKRFATA